MRLWLLVLSLAGFLTSPAAAQSKAEAAGRPPVTIPIFVSSRSDQCYDPDEVAAIGLSNTQRAKAAFDANAQALRDAAIPFLSNISVNAIYEPDPAVFTTQASQDDQRLPILRVNSRIAHHKWLKRTFAFLHITGVPLALAAVAGHVRGLATVDI